MPDAHTGYGMPIGGVLHAGGAVVPYAIGVDIGCGVALVETDLRARDLPPKRLAVILDAIAERIPVGTRSHPRAPDRDRALGEIGLPVPAAIRGEWLDRALPQLGTLGSGNHFLELQRDPDGRVHVMLHSGSRSLGKQICDAYHRRALAFCRATAAPLPHSELAYLPEDDPGFADYWAAMTYALRFAEVNRARMLAVVQTSSSGTPGSAGSRSSSTSTTTSRPARSTSAAKVSSTARAPSEPGPASPSSSPARWRPPATWRSGWAMATRSRRASTAPGGR